MTTDNSSIQDALAALERERVENVRLRRKLLDLLYNLDEENMPAVIARIEKSEAALAAENERLALLFTTDGTGAPRLRVDELVKVLGEEGVSLLLASLALAEGNAALSLSPTTLTAVPTESHPPRTYEYRSTLSPALLEMKSDGAGSVSGGDLLTLSPHGLCMPYLRRKASAATSGLYPLYIDKDGNILATYP